MVFLVCFPSKRVGRRIGEPPAIVADDAIFILFIFSSHYADIDPENQNFLLDSNLGKKKYETQYVST